MALEGECTKWRPGRWRFPLARFSPTNHEPRGRLAPRQQNDISHAQTKGSKAQAVSKTMRGRGGSGTRYRWTKRGPQGQPTLDRTMAPYGAWFRRSTFFSSPVSPHLYFSSTLVLLITVCTHHCLSSHHCVHHGLSSSLLLLILSSFHYWFLSFTIHLLLCICTAISSCHGSHVFPYGQL